MEITASLVKELREKTGVGMMDCKKALSNSGGDFEKAVQYLREKGMAAVSKKSDRDTKEGRVFVATEAAGQHAVLLEMSCETDFVANNTDFALLGNTLASALLASPAITQDTVSTLVVNGRSTQEFISESILKLGENITIKQLGRVSAGAIAQYIHMNGKIGVVVGFANPIDPEMGRDIAMHIAASAPLYLDPTGVPAADLESEKDIIRAQAINEGKPAEIAEKMVVGRINKFYKDVCLLEQSFVKDPEKSIQQLLTANSIVSFSRFSL